MKIGVVFPQTEIGSDPAAVRDYAQAAEEMGYSHISIFDHVLGAVPEGRPPGWRGAYTHVSNFHEPLVVFGYIAALTNSIEFCTSILILPQRQTALVAKQAAEVDILSNGRLRLGIGIGWNHVEYEALNEDFHTRGRRVSEQIELMRLLWTKEVVDFTGKYHRIDRAGLKPLPVQQPIPVWMGGMSEIVLKRTARLADGWFPQFRPGDPAARETMERFQGYIREAGRNVQDLGIEGRVAMTPDSTPEDWMRAMEEWREIGATHFSVSTMGAGLGSPRDHIDAIGRFKRAAGQFV
jgi:probable F420-dependent oxidoreductase